MKWSVVFLLATTLASQTACRSTNGGSTAASDDGTSMPADPYAPTPVLNPNVEPGLAREIYERVKYQLTAEDADTEIQVGEFEAFNFKVQRAYDPTIGAGHDDEANKAVITIVGAYVTLEMDASTGEPTQQCFTLTGTIDVARQGEDLSLGNDARANYDGQPTGC